MKTPPNNIGGVSKICWRTQRVEFTSDTHQLGQRLLLPAIAVHRDGNIVTIFLTTYLMSFLRRQIRVANYLLCLT